MEAARIKPDSPGKACAALSLLVIAAMLFVMNTGLAVSQITHEVGLTDNMAGAYGMDVSKSASDIKVFKNYPEPFTASTTIRFETAAQVNLRVTIYDHNGAFVKAYLFDNMAAGMHEVKVDGAEFPAGQYTYRFVSGNYSQSYKMNLVK